EPYEALMVRDFLDRQVESAKTSAASERFAQLSDQVAEAMAEIEDIERKVEPDARLAAMPMPTPALSAGRARRPSAPMLRGRWSPKLLLLVAGIVVALASVAAILSVRVEGATRGAARGHVTNFSRRNR